MDVGLQDLQPAPRFLGGTLDPRSPGSQAKAAVSPSASHEENPARLIPLAAQLDVSCHRFAVVALSSAVTVRDGWKDSVVARKYKELPIRVDLQR
ncbi:uncharacterized protein LOC142041118 isoform X3 [Buteo buteo]|uniref:uncharacterized protein LOC142041118 isoform X3 n=1 Tax=Buteo buteo TaxID=30397 RepID=UPI003EBCE327